MGVSRLVYVERIFIFFVFDFLPASSAGNSFNRLDYAPAITNCSVGPCFPNVSLDGTASYDIMRRILPEA